MPRPLIIGNWKMHKTPSQARTLVRRLAALVPKNARAEVVLAPPFTALQVSKQAAARRFTLAAQNMHWETEGAFTGEVSGPMLKALGCRYVILGHSERRTLFAEDDAAINKKVLAALKHKLRPVLCVGESLDERRLAATSRVVTRQLLRGLNGVSRNGGRRVTIAYEPVWAIGTGVAASPEQISAVHNSIRATLVAAWGAAAAKQARILYGGSVKAANAATFLALPEVNGALVGGACLDPRSFARIIAAAKSAGR